MTMSKQKSSPRKLARQNISAQRGIVLLEALVSILLFSMGVLALVGLQAAMIKNTSDSKFRAEASYIAQQRIGAMWADPDNVLGYLEPAPGTDISVSSGLPNGVRIVTQPNYVTYPFQFEVTVKWQQPGQLQHNYSTIINIAGGCTLGPPMC
jgi:type IV pilus assembly protein PilV